MSFMRRLLRFAQAFRRRESLEKSGDVGELTVTISYPRATTKTIGYTINTYSTGFNSQLTGHDNIIEIEDDHDELPTEDLQALGEFEVEGVHDGDRIFVSIESRDGSAATETIKVDSVRNKSLHYDFGSISDARL